MSSAFAIGKQAQSLISTVTRMEAAIEADDWQLFKQSVHTAERQAVNLEAMLTEFEQDLAKGAGS